MSFRFNFGTTEKNDEPENNTNLKDEETKELLRLHVKHEPTYESNLKELSTCSIQIGNHALNYINPNIATEKVKDSQIYTFLNSSDLESGHYEGGLKVWECTYDLLQYLSNNKQIMSAKAVLDLGCGAGLLGLYSFLNGANKICLQDYNAEVIKDFTIPTVLLTLKYDDIPDKKIDAFEFISGDWGNISTQFKKDNHDKFDLILSSETIYNVKYYGKLRDILYEHMSDNGHALFAAKTHYFGVGGGTYDFVKFLSESGLFKVDIVLKIDSGLSREILLVEKN